MFLYSLPEHKSSYMKHLLSDMAQGRFYSSVVCVVGIEGLSVPGHRKRITDGAIQMDKWCGALNSIEWTWLWTWIQRLIWISEENKQGNQTWSQCSPWTSTQWKNYRPILNYFYIFLMTYCSSVPKEMLLMNDILKWNMITSDCPYCLTLRRFNPNQWKAQSRTDASIFFLKKKESLPTL